MSQQATRIGFTIAAQVELSRRLRRALHGDPDFRRAFARPRPGRLRRHAGMEDEHSQQ